MRNPWPRNPTVFTLTSRAFWAVVLAMALQACDDGGESSDNIDTGDASDAIQSEDAENDGDSPVDTSTDTEVQGDPDATDAAEVPRDTQSESVDESSDEDAPQDTVDLSDVADLFPPGCITLGSNLGSPVYSGSNAGATDDFIASEDCNEFGASDGLDVHLCWQPPTGSRFVIDTFGSEIDTVLMVYDRSGAEIACNDDTESDESVFQSRVSVMGSDHAGETLLIVVDGWDETETGAFQVNIVEVTEETDCGDALDNDLDELVDCADSTSCQGLAACAPGSRDVGSSCTAHTDCSAADSWPHCLAEDSGYPGGLCAQWCTTDSGDVPCPACSACVVTGYGPYGNCASECDPTENTPCRSDQVTIDGDVVSYECGNISFSATNHVCGPDWWVFFEDCDDGIDNDADGDVDCWDDSCSGAHNCQEDPCDDGIDNDGDGLKDCEEPECSTWVDCAHETSCGDFLDNDGDDFWDCEDPTNCTGETTSLACTPGSAAPGTACSAHSTCAAVSGTDVPFCWGEAWGWPAGYCSPLCDPEADSCPAGSICAPIYPNGNAYCLDLCASDEDVPCRTDTVDYVSLGHVSYRCGVPAMWAGMVSNTVCYPSWADGL